MKICSKKDLKVMAGVLAAASLLGGCNVNVRTNKNILKGDSKARSEINLNEVSTTEFDENSMDALYRKYCFDIFSQTVKDYGSNDNIMISPASIMMAIRHCFYSCSYMYSYLLL